MMALRFKKMRFGRALCAALLLVLAAPALGVATAATTEGQVISFDIPAGPLGSALSRFAELSGLQLVYSSDLVAGCTTPGLKGSFTVNDALARLLAGTGLSSRRVSANAATIEKIDAKGAKVLGPVRIEGVQTAGANGSTDVTATEGTGSYTSGALTVGSKTPLSMRETPQSVSVLTQQRMRDQNLNDLTSALNQTTGITAITASNGTVGFVSRGLAIANFQFDGGAPANGSGIAYIPLADLSEFDHVEVLRGADGMFAGAGDPSGTVNLVRKRPLDHNQISLEGDAGSWNNYRAMMDVTGPLAPDGKVRGRAVMTYQSQNYFYDIAGENHTLLYGILEADLTPTTLVTLGGSFTRQNTVPFYAGLPRYQNGAGLRLPRSTCLCFDWNRWNFNTQELFVKLDQHIAEDWSIKANFTDLDQHSELKAGAVQGSVSPITLSGPLLQVSQQTYTGRQYLADLTLNGVFELFGRRHEIVIGGNWQDINSPGFTQFPITFPTYNSTSAFTSIKVFDFSSAAYPEPASPSPSRIYSVDAIKQYGAYATLRLQLLDSLHMLVGFRLSGYKNEQISQNFNPNGSLNGLPSTIRYSTNGVFTPYGGLVYDLTKDWSIYASYTDIFKSQASVLQGPPPGTPLPPIRGAEYEAGIKGELLDGGLNTSLSIYRINQKNAGVSDLSFPRTPGLNGASCCSLPVGDVESEGVDAEIAGQVLPGWQVFAGYTYNYNRYLYNTSSTCVAPNCTLGTLFQTLSPKHLIKFWTTYQLPDDWNQWTLGAGVNAQSSTYNSGTIPTSYNSSTGAGVGPFIPFHFLQGGYAVFSARVSYQIDDHWNAAVNINNILDKTYYQTVGNPNVANWYGDPRNFMFTIRNLN